MTHALVCKIAALFRDGASMRRIARTLRISRRTVSQALQQDDQASGTGPPPPKMARARPQQCCKIVADSGLCHLQDAAPTEIRARMAAPA